MLDRHARGATNRIFTPPARLLLRWGVTPDVVTVAGTLGVVVGALALFPVGHLFWGVMVITLFVFSDVLDGVMARLSGTTGRWGSFLDSTLDRVQDAAVFLGLMWWAFGVGEQTVLGVAASLCLASGMLVSYVRAKAEALGFTADTGIAERAERLIVTLVAAGLVGIGVPAVVLTVVLCLLAAASFVTVVQRMVTVRRQWLASHET
ncbi:CDP-alcohol phosphatidyltransferase family protein [Micrococcus lylae]|uniref:phosphatidylinositol phosphate synthase n=1 Tax=Micrococcus lylae TaxID=1273 RepID=UPI0021A72184|nr:CDP-alcohol phosphatidyltransferase family protein [Micrococcus lylae]MCT2007296.1 CDP-alcohol phosphatidyltransferase family protein [Micrococcus lylae]MCT2071030.1 CDP-alcohol phosphatidyltransferase family protein [Micrococcus lylae]